MVINCHHHPLLTVDQSLGMLDENLLGLCPLVPTWLLTATAASAALGWLEMGTLMTNSWHRSQPTLPPSSRTGLHLPAYFSFLTLPRSLVNLLQRLPRMSKSLRGWWEQRDVCGLLRPPSWQRWPVLLSCWVTGGSLRVVCSEGDLERPRKGTLWGALLGNL